MKNGVGSFRPLTAAGLVSLIHTLLAFAAFGAEPTAPTIVWAGQAGQAWSNPQNWNPARLPNSDDHVAIAASTNVTVSLDVAAEIASLAVGADDGSASARLVFNPNATLTLGSFSAVRRRGEIVLPDGTSHAIGGVGTLEIRGLLDWTGGQMRGGVVVAADGRAVLRGGTAMRLDSGTKTSPANLTNNGTVVWLGGNPLESANDAQIVNQGRWELGADGVGLSVASGGAATFLNRGTFLKTTGSGTTQLGGVRLLNEGTIGAAAGLLSLPDMTSEWRGGGRVAAGAGRVKLVDGRAVLAGNTTLDGTWEWDGRALTVFGIGSVDGPGALEWTAGRLSGTLTVTTNTVANLRGGAFMLVSSGTNHIPARVFNFGRVTWFGGEPLYVSYGSQLFNDGEWRLAADGIAFRHGEVGNWGSFDNRGKVMKTAGTNITSIRKLNIHNLGTMDVAAGTLQIDDSSSWEDGCVISGAGTLVLGPGVCTLDGTTKVNATWQWAGPYVYGTGTIDGSSPLIWRTGRVIGSLTIATGAQLQLTGEDFPWLYSESPASPAGLTNRGNVTWAGGRPLYAGQGAQIENRGLWHMQGAGQALAAIGNPPLPTFSNLGTVLKSGIDTASIDAFALHNRGRLSLTAGRLILSTPPGTAGEWHFPIRGTRAGTDYGVVQVVGTYALSADLRTELGSGYTPAHGDIFDVVSGNDLSGAFASLDLPALPGQDTWTVEYGPSRARLRVSDACLANGLVAWWRGDGNAAEQLSASAGTAVNGATYAPGLVGSAFALDGVNDYFNLGNTTPGPQWTLQAWVKLNALQPGRRAIFGGLADGRDWAFTALDGCLGLSFRPPGGISARLANPTPARTNVWYHLGATCNGVSVAFYLNGVLVDSAASEPGYVPTPGLRLGGATYNGAAENFAGLVDEATIHNQALTGIEISGTYGAGAGGRCAQLGLALAGFSPQGTVTTNVNRLSLRFSQPIREATFTPADLLVVGPRGTLAGASLTIAAAAPFDGRTFAVSLPPLTTEGSYAVTVGPNIETVDNLPMPAPCTAQFRIDKSTPVVTAVSPSGSAGPTANFDVTFSEAMNGASAQPADLSIAGPGALNPSAVAQVAANQFRFTLSQPLPPGLHTIAITGLTDLAGLSMSNYSTTIEISDPSGRAAITVGRTHLYRGQAGLVPLRLETGIGLTNVRFMIEQPAGVLSNLAIQALAPELGTATLTAQAPGRSLITLAPIAGQALEGERTLAYLRFTAPASGPSAFVPLNLTNLVVRRANGTLVSRPEAISGRVILIGDEPVLEALPAPPGEHHLALFGRPGHAYEIQSFSGSVPANWKALLHVPMFQNVRDLSWRMSGNAFYRALDYSPDVPRLETDGVDGPFILYGRSGVSYTVESTPNLNPPRSWQPVVTLTLDGPYQSVPGLIRTNGNEYFRVRAPVSPR